MRSKAKSGRTTSGEEDSAGEDSAGVVVAAGVVVGAGVVAAGVVVGAGVVAAGVDVAGAEDVPDESFPCVLQPMSINEAKAMNGMILRFMNFLLFENDFKYLILVHKFLQLFFLIFVFLAQKINVFWKFLCY